MKHKVSICSILAGFTGKIWQIEKKQKQKKTSLEQIWQMKPRECFHEEADLLIKRCSFWAEMTHSDPKHLYLFHLNGFKKNWFKFLKSKKKILNIFIVQKSYLSVIFL